MIHFPFAYVGPGAGFAFLGSLLSLLLSLLAGIASLLLWPFRAIWGLFRRRVQARVIVLGPGGLEPTWSAPGFWKLLGERNVDSTVLLIPGAPPAEGFRGRWFCRSEEGQMVSQPPYYAKYLTRLLGPLHDPEALFFSALDHQKRGVLACVFEIPDSDLDRIIGRLRGYTDSKTMIFVLSDQRILFSNRELEGAGIRDVAPTVLRIFGIQQPEWMEGKPVIHLA